MHDAELSLTVPAQDRRKWWRLLLVIPLIGTLWVPFYNHAEPSVLGFPFFYWYLLLWVPISAAVSVVVYFKTRDLI